MLNRRQLEEASAKREHLERTTQRLEKRWEALSASVEEAQAIVARFYPNTVAAGIVTAILGAEYSAANSVRVRLAAPVCFSSCLSGMKHISNETF